MSSVRGVLTIALTVLTILQLGSLVCASSPLDPAVSVQVFSSPTQVQTTQRFEVLVAVSNGGKATLSNLSVLLVVPPGWTENLTSAETRQLVANQSELVHYNVTVASSATLGSYTLVALANSTSASAQGNISITVQANPTTIPIAGGQIPVSLVMILIPGFLTLGLVQWIRGKGLDSAWQTGLLSFLLGSLEWYFGPWPLLGPLLQATFLNLTPASVTTLEYGYVVLWLLAIGVAAGIILRYSPWVKAAIGGWLGKRVQRYSALRRGYYQGTGPEWGWTLNYQYEETIRQQGKNYRPNLEVTTAQHWSEKKTEKPIKGLLVGFDDKDPFDITLGPQYVLKVPWTSKGKDELLKALPLDAQSGVSNTSTLADAYRTNHMSTKVPQLFAKVQEVNQTPSETKGELKGQEMVKGADIRRILICGYKPKFEIEVTQDGKSVTLS